MSVLQAYPKAGMQVFETMNGLRGVAALVVVAVHWSLRDPLHLDNGWLAVDLFFVLSGFVIAHSYEARLRDGLPVKEFFLLRLVRLYPLYILGSLLAMAIVAVSYTLKGRVIEEQRILSASIPFAVFMLPTPFWAGDLKQAQLFPLNLPAWSLFFELTINVAYALTVRFWTELRLAVLIACVGALLIASYALGANMDGGWRWSDVYMGELRVLYSFPAGVLLYKLHRRGVRGPSIPSLAVVALFLLLILLPSAWGPLFSMLAGFPVLVILAANSEPQGRLAAAFSAVGAASYAVYALHQPAHAFIAAVFAKLGLPLGLPVDIVLIVSIVPVCMAVDRLYDTPVRKCLARVLLRPGAFRRVRLHGVSRFGIAAPVAVRADGNSET